MSEHTKAPWRRTGINIHGPRHEPIAQMSQASLLPGSIAEQEANARLIAAAPDLYAACVALVNGDDMDAMNMARAAIARAEGK
jgi:hypothetical protein